MHELTHLTGIAMVASVALLFGLFLIRMKQTAIVGYIIAGAVLGPTGLKLIEDGSSIRLLAELGVLLLLFLIGMEMNVKAFRQFMRTALTTVGLQTGFALIFTLGAAFAFDWPYQRGVLFGFVVALSSTAVTVKILQDIGEQRTQVGRVTMGVLIGQDLAVVPMLLTLQAMNPATPFEPIILLKLLAAALVIGGVFWFLLKADQFRLPFRAALARDKDIIALGALTVCFLAATATGLMGLSTAFGAFLAGLVIGNSTEKHLLLRNTQPIQSVLMVVFFLSVGLLIDWQFIVENAREVIIIVLLITVVKALINIFALRIAGENWDRAVLGGIVMGQVGEFSFVLAGAGLAAGVIVDDGYKMAVAVIALSLMLGPVWVLLFHRAKANKHLGRTIDAAIGASQARLSAALRGARDHALELVRAQSNRGGASKGSASKGPAPTDPALSHPGTDAASKRPKGAVFTSTEAMQAKSVAPDADRAASQLKGQV